MARDFRAKQLRTSIIIGSGSIESNRPNLGLVFYSASKASDFDGTRRTGGSTLSSATQLNLSKDAIALPHRFGDDVWCLFDGQSVSQNATMTTERTKGSTVLFLGDVAISGSLFAERQIIEVDTTAAGDFRTPVGSNAFFDGGFAGEGVDITANGEVKAFTSVRSPIFLNDSANVTLKTTTSGNVDIHPISGITRFKFDADSSATLTVANNSHTTLATAESGNLTLDSAGTVTLDAASTAAGGIHLNSAGGIDLDAAGGITLDSVAGPVSIGSTHNNASAIDITTNGGSAEKILIKNTQGILNSGENDAAIRLEAAAGGITLDAEKDIQLDANGGQIKFTDNGVSHFDFDCDTSSFTIYDDSSEPDSDVFKIQVANNGLTTLSTVDSDGTSGGMNLSPDGYLAFKPINGIMMMYDGATFYSRFFLSNNNFNFEVYDSADNLNPLLSFENATANSTEPSVRVHSNHKLEFHDDSQFIHAPSDNNLTVKVNDSITLDAGDRATGDHAGTGTTVDSGAVLMRNTGIHIGGAGTGVGVASVAATQSPIRIFKATQTVYPASQNTNSSHVNWPFDGTSGSPVAQAGDLVISNRTSFNGVNANGNIIFDGAVTIANQAVNNLTVTGDLLVQGTTTTLDTANLLIEDPFILLAKNQTGAAGLDAGFIIERGDNTNVAFIWDETNGDVFRAITTNSAADTAGNVATSGHVPVAASEFYLESSANKIDLNTDVIVTAAADVTFTVAGGNVTPTANDGAALGSADKNWSDLFLADSSVLNFGDDQDVTLTHVHDTGLLINSGKQIQFGHADENIRGDGTNLTVASGGDVNISPTNNVVLPAGKSIQIGSILNTITADNLNNFYFTAGDDMQFQTGGASGDYFLFRNGSNTTQSTRLQIGNSSTYIERLGGSSTVQFVSDRPIKIDCAGTLTLDGSSGVNIKHNNNATLSVTRSTDTVLLANHANDIVFQTNPGSIAEIARFDTSESSLLMAGQNKIQFDDANKYIHYDGTDLTLVSNSDIKLDPDGNDVTIVDANAQLNFNSADQRIYLDSNELKFRDGAQTTPVTLSDLASVSPSPTAILSATGDNRARIMGFTSIDSSNFYLNQASHPANGQDDVFLYVGDDGGNRTNSAFKNSLAVSGSISMVDTADNLSATKFTQTSDNLIVTMNTSTAGNGNATLHNLLTLESASGLKLGTTAGSGNAGLYFQGAGLNLQKINTTVEGSAQDCIQIQGHLLPQADNSFNLGTASRRFANLYTGDLHLNNMGSSNDVDGTSGNWTIQEGEDNLYVINNLTGKKFKMMLQPVEDGE